MIGQREAVLARRHGDADEADVRTQERGVLAVHGSGPTVLVRERKEQEAVLFGRDGAGKLRVVCRVIDDDVGLRRLHRNSLRAEQSDVADLRGEGTAVTVQSEGLAEGRYRHLHMRDRSRFGPEEVFHRAARVQREVADVRGLDVEFKIHMFIIRQINSPVCNRVCGLV